MVTAVLRKRKRRGRKQSNMPKYKVGVWEEQGGYIYIEAKNKIAAAKKADQYLEDNGIGDEVDVTHRDYHIISEPEIAK